MLENNIQAQKIKRGLRIDPAEENFPLPIRCGEVLGKVQPTRDALGAVEKAFADLGFGGVIHSYINLCDVVCRASPNAGKVETNHPILRVCDCWPLGKGMQDPVYRVAQRSPRVKVEALDDCCFWSVYSMGSIRPLYSVWLKVGCLITGSELEGLTAASRA